ncbi:MAG: hypothetical protein H0V14_10390 [Chitinophagaceae bacterium]|nr:hypothetical protein [Chitinophagaceae bacterium]
MQPEIYYQEKLQDLQLQLSIQLKYKSKLGWLRFIIALFIIVSVYFLWPAGLAFVIPVPVILLIVFVKLVFADNKNKYAIQHTRHLININEDEVKALDDDYYHFAEGNEFLPKDHFYANDLDIFGRASLFQYINRTTSEMGGNTLAQWLLRPADAGTILKRQIAIKELSAKTEWRQQFQAYGKEQIIKNTTQQRLSIWLNEPDKFLQFKHWMWIRYVLQAIIITVLFLNIFDDLPTRILNIFLLVYAVIAYTISKKVSPIHQQLSKMVAELDVLSDSIQLIEKAQFTSPLLQQLQAQYQQQKSKSSYELNQLKKILERLDLRYNPVVFIPLAIFLLWDLQQVLALEKWKKYNEQNVIQWFDVLGNFEALNSLSTLCFNNAGWSFPLLHDKHFFIEGKQIGHPLISKTKRVVNDIFLDKTGELMLVTGSNMAGKSTYLRSVGINIVLAMAGAPVCAKCFILSPVQLISSMRIADNLEESTSTFYAELKKLKTIIDKVNNGERVFILLDEILRGTNSLDRHIGSIALIKQLIKHNAAGIIATHDVELAKMQETYAADILNYHFDVQVSHEELHFDYLLKPGICTSMNASILMKKIGIEL